MRPITAADIKRGEEVMARIDAHLRRDYPEVFAQMQTQTLREQATQAHHDARVAAGMPVGTDAEDTLDRVSNTNEWPETRGVLKVRGQGTAKMNSTEMEAHVAQLMGNTPPKAKAPIPAMHREFTPSTSSADERAALAKLSAEEKHVGKLMGVSAVNMIRARTIAVAR